jgi:hypothetical protein
MIGITVLSVIAIWIALAVLICRRIPRWFGAQQHHTIVSVAVFPFVLIAPVADEIVGNVYMETKLCSDAGRLIVLKAMESVHRAERRRLPDETVWFGIPITKLQANYVDLDTQEIFAYTRSYVTYGGILMRLGLNLGNFSSCGRWTTKPRHFTGPSPTDKKLEELLKAGEVK